MHPSVPFGDSSPSRGAFAAAAGPEAAPARGGAAAGGGGVRHFAGHFNPEGGCTPPCPRRTMPAPPRIQRIFRRFLQHFQAGNPVICPFDQKPLAGQKFDGNFGVQIIILRKKNPAAG